VRRVIVLLVVGVGLCGAAAGAAALALTQGGSARGTAAVLGSALDPAYPAVAADGSRGFDAVWTDSEAEIVTAHRSAITGQWSRPVALSGRVGQAQARIAGSASGTAAAVWSVNTASDQLQAVQASYRPSVTGAWQPAVTLARSGTDWRSLHVGVDAHGDAFAAWINGRGVEMSEHPAAASAWSAPVTVEADRRAGAGSSLDLALAVSPSGTIALVWERYLDGSTLGGYSGTRDDLLLAVRSVGRRGWLPRVSLGLDGMASGQSDTDPYWYGPQITINAHGTIFVASQWPHAGRYRARAAVITPGDHWRRPRFVTLPGAGLEPTITAGAQGYSTVV
jgi:hypothetical protein